MFLDMFPEVISSLCTCPCLPHEQPCWLDLHTLSVLFKPLLCSQNSAALQVEKHIRKNKLTAGTFSEQVGASSHADNESTDREARKLAFFLYWNIKPTFTRYRACHSCLLA